MIPGRRARTVARRRQPGALAELDGVIYKMRHYLYPTFLFPIVSEVVPCFAGFSTDNRYSTRAHDVVGTQHVGVHHYQAQRFVLIPRKDEGLSIIWIQVLLLGGGPRALAAALQQNVGVAAVLAQQIRVDGRQVSRSYNAHVQRVRRLC